ncbi:hypothetical protein ACQCN2_07495 [Brevibacillus ginsengisoli]|uniref:hypothetical protein n=1 Tax=Brevibacillus ginsengisoli TaxID=363854 RepID=UPI003CF186C9
MDVQVWMASKEVADRLNVHVRTLRNWLDLFVPITDKQKNPQGHYLISELGFQLLKEVKIRKDAGNSSLRDIHQQMMAEGLLTEDMRFIDEEEAANETAVMLQDSKQLQSTFREIELTVSEALLQFQQEIANLSTMQQMQSTILQKIADMEERQESLRLEMRRVTFEMDLMHQRLTRRKHRTDRTGARWSLNPFRWFSRTDRVAAD